MPDLEESSRRKSDASGPPLRLADGAEWLLAIPRFTTGGSSFSTPDVDAEIDSIFESTTIWGEVSVEVAWSAARILLKANYELSDDEFVELIYGVPTDRVVTTVVLALFGDRQAPRSYLDWTRASLLSNGLSGMSVDPTQLSQIMSILVATRRTVPASHFVDATKAAEEYAQLESLV